MTAEITVTARHWAHGWELILDEDNATQVRSLANADQQVRDYLETIDPDADHAQTRITLIVEDASIRRQIEDARRARQEAEAAEAEAAQRIRSVVSTLRHDNGYSLADSAALLGVSRARITQLEKKSTTAATRAKNCTGPVAV